jgi:nitrate reductase gamma subunit
MTTLLWVVLPYTCLAVFVAGHVWRWWHDQFGWTTHTSQLLDNRLLRLGSPLFHLGAFGVIGGHAMGLLVPEWFTERLGVPEASTTSSRFPAAWSPAACSSSVWPC